MRSASLMYLLAGLLCCGHGCAATVWATPNRNDDGPVAVSAAVVGSDTVARFFHQATMLNDGKVMVTGGLGLQLFPSPTLFSRNHISFFDPSSETFSATYHPTDGSASTTPTLLTARSSHAQITLADGRVLITGGYTNASGTSPGMPTDTAELFDPVTGTMAAVGPMQYPRVDHSAALLSDGSVLIAGGDTEGTWELFDPATDAFSEAANMQHRRAAHAAVLLPAGNTLPPRVLMIAGRGTGATTMEYLDPAAGTSELIADIAFDLHMDDHAAALREDGKVLIVGGQNLHDGNTLENTWLFDPVHETLSDLPAVPDHPDGIQDHQLIRFGRFVLLAGGEAQSDGVDTELDSMAVFDQVSGQWVFSGTMHHPHDDAPMVQLDAQRALIIGGGVPLFGLAGPSANAEIITLICQLPGDVTGDCRVDVQDLLAVIGQWGCHAETSRRASRSDAGDGCSCSADLTGDCVVGVADLLQVIANWGQ